MTLFPYLLVIAAICQLTAAIGNPGILVSVPFPLDIPTLPLKLPLSIDNIAISNLELTNVSLRELDFKWKLDIKNAVVNVPLAQISFDWNYKKDSGFGYFREDELKL